MVYPVTLEDSNGNSVIANDESEFIELVSQDLMFFVFPFDLVADDGSIVTAYDVDGLFTLLIDCNGFDQDSVWDWENDFEYLGCYIVEFPMDVVLQDGSVVTVNNHMELCDLMLEGEIVDYAYPLELIDEEGNVIVVNSQDELNELLDDCFGDTWVGDGDMFLLIVGAIDSTGMEGCYSINFPISGETINENGVSIIVQFNSIEEILNSNFPIVNVLWPVTVTLAADGTEVILNSLEDQLNLLDDCN